MSQSVLNVSTETKPEQKDDFQFWDIESYENFFCAAFISNANDVLFFYMVNSIEDEKSVFDGCQEFCNEWSDWSGSLEIIDLKKDSSKLEKLMEKPIPKNGNNTEWTQFLDIKGKVVEPKSTVLFAYNCLSYDLPMIDKLLESTLGNKVRASTKSMRQYSDTLIDRTINVYHDPTAHKVYGNHVDIAALNEKQWKNGKPQIGLKTAVGILGGSIIESPSNKSGFSKDIKFDTKYCLNDVREMKDEIFNNVLKNIYDIRSNLINMYPVLKQKGLTPNETSSSLVEYIVAPEKPIDDDRVVNFMYPAAHIAKREGVEQKDILEYTKDWYMKHVYDVVKQHNPKMAKYHLSKFMSIYGYYNDFRGKNWNTGTNYVNQFGINDGIDKSERRRLLDTWGTYLPFIDKYGNESSTHVNFSAGGIHGKEINQRQLDLDRKRIKELKEKYKYISKIPKNAVSKTLLNLIIKQSRTAYKDYPKRLSHEIPFMYKATEQSDEILDPEDFSPFIYNNATQFEKRQEVLLPRYAMTTQVESIHQDFDGYYPKLIINLGIFYDGNGKDNFEEVYNLRIGLKSKLKTLVQFSKEWLSLDVDQNGYKLVLNSASGVLDGSSNNTFLRANNKGLKMRIIGQLFTWIIAQALALEGADVPSSNTDGIYVSNIPFDLNKQIVDRELKPLLVNITPECMQFVSKDSNNRLEVVDGKVHSARGGSLTSWQGPDIRTNQSQPAIVDSVLTRYLQRVDLFDEVNEQIIREELEKYKSEVDIRKFIYMTAWILRSTSGSILIDDRENIHPGTLRVWLSDTGRKLKRYTTSSSGKSASLDNAASKLFDNSPLGEPEVISYLSDLNVFQEHLLDATLVGDYKATPKMSVPKYKDEVPTENKFRVVKQTKISKFSDTAKAYIHNGNIKDISEDELQTIYNHIDMDEYVKLIADAAKVWHNTIVE